MMNLRLQVNKCPVLKATRAKHRTQGGRRPEGQEASMEPHDLSRLIANPHVSDS